MTNAKIRAIWKARYDAPPFPIANQRNWRARQEIRRAAQQQLDPISTAVWRRGTRLSTRRLQVAWLQLRSIRRAM